MSTRSRRRDRHQSERHQLVALYGHFGTGNFGNDATLAACIGGLTEHLSLDLLLCVTPAPESVTEQFGIAAVPIDSPRRQHISQSPALLRYVRRGGHELTGLLRACGVLKQTRALVIVGTGVLDDQHTNAKMAVDLLRWSIAARITRSRLVYLAVGAGPIDRRSSRRLLLAATWLAHEVSFRDARAMEYMGQLGRDVARDRVLPDLALALAVAEMSPTAPRRAAVGVLWRGNWAARSDAYQCYESRIVELAVGLQEDGWEPRLIIGDEVDLVTVRVIMARLDAAGVYLEEPRLHDMEDLIESVAGCAVVVASRYHNVVAAVIAGRPVISLSYGPKNRALLEKFGVPEWDHDIDDFDVDVLIEEIKDLAELQGPLYRDALASARATLKHEFAELARV